MSPKQKAIIQFCRDQENRQITKREAVELIGYNYYANAAKHTGEVLARMVKGKLLNRVSRGIYCLGSGKSSADYVAPKEQLSLFQTAAKE